MPGFRRDKATFVLIKDESDAKWTLDDIVSLALATKSPNC